MFGTSDKGKNFMNIDQGERGCNLGLLRTSYFENENRVFCARGPMMILPQPRRYRVPPSFLAPVCGVGPPPRPVQSGEKK